MDNRAMLIEVLLFPGSMIKLCKDSSFPCSCFSSTTLISPLTFVFLSVSQSNSSGKCRTSPWSLPRGGGAKFGLIRTEFSRSVAMG